MFTIEDYIESLKNDKSALVQNLIEKGISATDIETFTTLVPKVLDIIQTNNQSKNVTITENGTSSVTPDTGYTGLSEVNITTNVDADVSKYFTSTISAGTNNYPGVAKMIKNIPSDTTISGNSLISAFSYCSNLLEFPLIDTANVQNMNACFYQCTNLRAIANINTSNCTIFQLCFGDCTNLTDVPLLNTSKANSMFNMFSNCPNLTDTSLDNILQMCINSLETNKTLTRLGIKSTNYPASRIQALPHYQDFINAGWTIS